MNTLIFFLVEFWIQFLVEPLKMVLSGINLWNSEYSLYDNASFNFETVLFQVFLHDFWRNRSYNTKKLFVILSKVQSVALDPERDRSNLCLWVVVFEIFCHVFFSIPCDVWFCWRNDEMCAANTNLRFFMVLETCVEFSFRIESMPLEWPRVDVF